MATLCRFGGDDDAGILRDDVPLIDDVPLPFTPFRSLAHLRLVEALAGSSPPTVELHGPRGIELRRVAALTPNTIILTSIDADH